MGLVRAELQPLLLRLAGRDKIGPDEAAEIGKALLDIESLADRLEGLAPELRYGIPPWLAAELDRVIGLVEQPDLRWAEVAGLLFQSKPTGAEAGRAATLTREALARAARLTNAVAKPAGYALREAVRADAPATGRDDVDAEARWRRSLLDLPLLIPGEPDRAILASLEIRFEQGDPDRPGVRSVGQTAPSPEFEAGLKEGLWAALDLLLKLGVPDGVRRQHAHLIFDVIGLPADLPPLVGSSAGLPAALHTLGSALGLGPVDAVCSGPVGTGGEVERLDRRSAQAKQEAVAADGLRDRFLCNWAEASEEVGTLAAAALAVWGEDWTEAVTRLLDRKLEDFSLRGHWRLPWEDLVPPRELDGVELLGSTGNEDELVDGLRAGLGTCRLVLGPPGSGRTTLVARTAAALGGTAASPAWRVVRLTPQGGPVTAKLDAVCRDLRLAVPGPTPLLIVVDSLDADLEDLADLVEFETSDPQVALLIVTSPVRLLDAEETEALADMVVAELGAVTAINIARDVAEAHKSLKGVTPERIRAVVRRSHGNLTLVIDRLAEIGGAAGSAATAERFAAATTDVPVRSILTLACRSTIGLATSPERLDEVTLQTVRPLGVSITEDGWLIRSPGLAEDLVGACALRIAREGGPSRRTPAILRDHLTEEVRRAAREYADAEVVALLTEMARNRPALLRSVMDALGRDLGDWARRADVRSLRGFLLVGHSRMGADLTESLLDLFAEKLLVAIEENELTGLEVARGLRLLLLEHARFLEETAQGPGRRARLLTAIASRLDELLTNAGPLARQRLLTEMQHLDVDGSVFLKHAAIALEDLRPGHRTDYQLALSVLKAMRGLPVDDEPVKLVVDRVTVLTAAAQRHLADSADLVVLTLALAIELERYGAGLNAPRPHEGPRERDFRTQQQVSKSIGRLYDQTNPFRLMRALGELAQVHKGVCSQLLTELEKTEKIHERIAGSLRSLGPVRAARTLAMAQRVGDSLAFAVLFRKGKGGSKPRGSLLRSLKASIARTLDAKGAYELLQIARTIDEGWGRRRDGFAHALCEQIGADLLVELIDMHRHDRVTADLIGVVVASTPSIDLMRPLTDQVYEPLAEALVRNREVAWPGQAAILLGGDMNPGSEAFMNRMREDERVVEALTEMRSSARDAPTFTRANQLSLALLPERSSRFRSTRAWVPAITEARSLTDAVEAFGAASFTLSQDSEGEGPHEAAAVLREAGWSWREALALGVTSQKVSTALGQLKSIYGNCAWEAVSTPKEGEEDRLLGWVSRNDGRSPQVHSDLLQRVAKIDAARAAELLDQFREKDPGHWGQLLRVARSDPNPRTQARIYRSLGLAGYSPPDDLRAELLDAWTAPTGAISYLRGTPAISELLTVCADWRGGEAAIRAIDGAAVADTLGRGRDQDLPAAGSLIGQLYIARRQFPELEPVATRIGLKLAHALCDLDDLPWRVGMRRYSQLIGAVARTDPDLRTRLWDPAQEHLELQIARRHRWRPRRHWIKIGWLAWELASIGFAPRTTVTEPPASLGGVAPAQRLFALGWLDGPPWVARYVEEAFAAVENQRVRGSDGLATVLAAAAHHGQVRRMLATDQPWGQVLRSRPGTFSIFAPALREGDPELIEFFRGQEGLDALVESLRAKARELNFGAGLFLEALEEVGLAEEETSAASRTGGTWIRPASAPPGENGG